ncbi:unnamed protein product, partial [Prorocentrum cordatum]
ACASSCRVGLPVLPGSIPPRVGVVQIAPCDPRREGSADPTPSPTPSSVQGTGDPHLVNIYGEHFDIYQPGAYVPLQVPRGASLDATRLLVKASVEQFGAACGEIGAGGLPRRQRDRQLGREQRDRERRRRRAQRLQQERWRPPILRSRSIGGPAAERNPMDVLRRRGPQGRLGAHAAGHRVPEHPRQAPGAGWPSRRGAPGSGRPRTGIHQEPPVHPQHRLDERFCRWPERRPRDGFEGCTHGCDVVSATW